MCSNALHCDFIAHTANRLLKHTNPQFYIGNTDLTRRSDWPGGALLGNKIHPVGPFLTQFNAANQAFPATKRPKGSSCVFQCLALRFHCTHCAQIVESLVPGGHDLVLAPNPQFYIGNTDLTRRLHWRGGALPGTKIHHVGPLIIHFNTAKQAFPAT